MKTWKNLEYFVILVTQVHTDCGLTVSVSLASLSAGKCNSALHVQTSLVHHVTILVSSMWLHLYMPEQECFESWLHTEPHGWDYNTTNHDTTFSITLLIKTETRWPVAHSRNAS